MSKNGLLKFLGEPSTTPGEHPDWIGKKLEALAAWISQDSKPADLAPIPLPILES